MSGYSLVDFRGLVGLWYNEYLPTACGKRAGFIESVGIVYLNSINLEPHLKPTAQFFLRKLAEMGQGCKIVVQEPKPVNNVRIQPTLKVVEGIKGVSDQNKLKLLHMSNRRYVPMSASVLVAQEKEIDSFLDKVFRLLAKLNMEEVKFLGSSALGMSDVIEVARSFFPRKMLNVVDFAPTFPITVQSTNEILLGLGERLKCRQDDGSLKFLDKCKESLTKEFEKLL